MGAIVPHFYSEEVFSLFYGRDFGQMPEDWLAQTVWSIRNLLDLIVFRASGMSAPTECRSLGQYGRNTEHKEI